MTKPAATARRPTHSVTGNPCRRTWTFAPDFHFDLFVNRSAHELSRAVHEATRVYFNDPLRPSLHPCVIPMQEHVVPITTHLTEWLSPCVKSLASTIIDEYHRYLAQLPPSVREGLFGNLSMPPEVGVDEDEDE